MQRKLGCAVTFLAPFVGYPIMTNGKSRRLRVDAFGNNVAAAPGVSGDHARTTHDAICMKVVQHIKRNRHPRSRRRIRHVQRILHQEH
jgi:hypothetical protein